MSKKIKVSNLPEFDMAEHLDGDARLKHALRELAKSSHANPAPAASIRPSACAPCLIRSRIASAIAGVHQGTRAL
jgi:hypothetical protein